MPADGSLSPPVGQPSAPESSSDPLAIWQRHYPLPAEEKGQDDATGKSRTHLYRPPKSDLPGIMVACTVIGTWAAVFIHAMFFVKLPYAPGVKPDEAASWLHIAAVFFSLEFLYTGLFITTHDAMHGTIAYRNRRLNDLLGKVAISLYAWFDYGMLHRKHWEHHNHTGVPNLDPDFHRGNPNLLVWFVQFMVSYSTPMQYVKLAAWANVLGFLGAPTANQATFMAGAAILAAFRLFYYGTYVPHCPEQGHTGPMPWHVSRTSPSSPLLSFLTCYHFDYHWEHHRWPYAPWWQLPYCRRIAGRIGRAAAARGKALGHDAAPSLPPPQQQRRTEPWQQQRPQLEPEGLSGAAALGGGASSAMPAAVLVAAAHVKVH